jgi:2-amino-4-hydroxy-6-hydroxymethyldihydropteridine diphosphokinase
MTLAYLSLGSNLGDRLGYLARAVSLLDRDGAVVLRTSSVYETAPQGKTDQPAFLNMVIEVDTVLTPKNLLRRIQTVESVLGRVRTVRWGPRTIDIDLLLYNETILYEADLELPHPRMGDRAFVLIPLLELGDPAVPGSGGRPYRDLLPRVEGQEICPVLNATLFMELVRGTQ